MSSERNAAPCGKGRASMQVNTPRNRIFLFASVGLMLLAAQASRAAGDCPCEHDINNDGTINVNDPLTIATCLNGDCSGCVNSCDVNCDGTIDLVDFGVSWCQFEVNPGFEDFESCCNEPTGACLMPDDRFNIFPECSITLQGACEFHAEQNGAGEYLGDGTTLAACGIPAVSQWGLVALTLVLVTAATILIRRSRYAAACSRPS